MKKLVFSLLLIFLLTSCTQTADEKGLSITGYFASEDNAYTLVPYTIFIKNEGVAAIPELFSKLHTSPSKKLSSPIPMGLSLLDYSILEETCTLKLSPSYNTLSATQKVFLNAVITNTFCQLPGIDCVLISCEEKLTMLSPDEFLTTLPRTRYDSYTVNLYFTTENHTRAVKETKSISISDNTNLEKEVILLLCENSSSEKADSPFPAETKINSVVTIEGTCIIDVSNEFVLNAPHEVQQEKCILFSIVNTLTELPKIDRVKFLIDGQDGYGYTHYDISKPLTNLEDLLNI